MTDYYFTFRSVTTAQRARKLCSQARLNGCVQRTPKQMARQGCGYCLIVPERHARQAADIFLQAELPLQKIYQMTAAGPKEVTL